MRGKPKIVDIHLHVPKDLYGDIKTRRDRMSRERRVKITMRECIIDAIMQWLKK